MDPVPAVRQRRSVTFCAPEENQVYECPPPPGRPWRSKAKRFLSKFFTTSSVPQSKTQSIGLPGAGILSFWQNEKVVRHIIRLTFHELLQVVSGSQIQQTNPMIVLLMLFIKSRYVDSLWIFNGIIIFIKEIH